MTTVKNGFMPPSLVSNLQAVLKNRKTGEQQSDSSEEQGPEIEHRSSNENKNENASSLSATDSRPVLLLTCDEGIEASGLRFLTDALVADGRFNVTVCAPESDKSGSGHSVTIGQTVSATSVEFNGATAYKVSGTTVDCISLALSGALFNWKKPTLVICGINKGSNCGYRMIYSGSVAGAREALMLGFPAIAISLNWKDNESNDNKFKDAVEVCLPLIYASVQDVEKDIFPKGCVLNVDVPTHPSDNKGMKITKQSSSCWHPSWKTENKQRHVTGHYMSNQQSLGIQLAQLGQAASAAGAARYLKSQRKLVEVESVAETGKLDIQSTPVRKFFRAEFSMVQNEEDDNDVDSKALEQGFVTVTPIGLGTDAGSEIHTIVASWFNVAIDQTVVSDSLM